MEARRLTDGVVVGFIGFRSAGDAQKSPNFRVGSMFVELGGVVGCAGGGFGGGTGGGCVGFG